LCAFLQRTLAVAKGDPEALTLFGKPANERALFAERIAGSETVPVGIPITLAAPVVPTRMTSSVRTMSPKTG